MLPADAVAVVPRAEGVMDVDVAGGEEIVVVKAEPDDPRVHVHGHGPHVPHDDDPQEMEVEEEEEGEGEEVLVVEDDAGCDAVCVRACTHVCMYA